MAKKSAIVGAAGGVGAGGEIAPALPMALPDEGRPADGLKAKIGRPGGARNLATRQMVEYLRRNYADPLEGMAATISRTVDDLVKELGCTKLEAFDRMQVCRRELAPYLYAKVPANLKLEGEGRFVLTIGDEVDPSAVEEDTGGEFDIEGEVVKPQENQ